MFKTLVLASDHGGFALKQIVRDMIASEYPEIALRDLGVDSDQSVDYPEYGQKAGVEVHEGRADGGIIFCGSGIGISIAANRFSGVRAALCADATMAGLARAHNDANILALGQRIIGVEVALDCVRAFLETGFEGGRHERRVAQLGTIC